MLVLGGGWFVGRALVMAGHDAGHEVTVFNRGRSAPPPGPVTVVRGDRTDAADLRRLAGHGPWDVVVDVHGVVPRQVGAAARVLRGVVGRYVLVSTVSAYRDWPERAVHEGSPVKAGDPDADPEDWSWGTGVYGQLKAGAEAAAARAVDEQRLVVLRPGVILGPGEYGGRLTWWLRRAAAGGELLAPGASGDVLRPVDVRDLAAFILRLVEQQASGTYNVAGPVGRDTWGHLVEACLAATGATATVRWVDGEWLADQGVQQWVELPMWRTAPGTWAIDTTRAEGAGLTCRPLVETVADTWAWLSAGGQPVTTDRESMHGLGLARERELLERWRARLSAR
ncbi:NAD-dependent epimerase/dehydratase family protein [Couchioplanes azureus]|uniref:NAD-dependent epimerase/dehydratase family protein n=1 Tax=Couchioplanes caeruleus TaxID=56438 RepID=UPI0016712D3C|nr:NAD-dependent epimerase/dehydratase family protein [Couchioplanes caeruleus]